MNTWYLGGGALTAWAVLLAAVGIARPGFPGGGRGAVVVMALTAALVAAAIASAIYGSIAEEKEHEPEKRATLAPRA